MGIHLAHNIRLLKIELKKKKFGSWLGSVKFAFFFNVLLQQVGVVPSWSCHALFLQAPNSWDEELSADVSFVSVLATVLSEYWKKARRNIFFKWYFFEEIVKIVSFWKKFSSLFQYSERTVASTETNDTSAESSRSQLFGARRTRAWHDQGGATPTCRKRTLKKKN
jgi:hypothetical protein